MMEKFLPQVKKLIKCHASTLSKESATREINAKIPTQTVSTSKSATAANTMLSRVAPLKRKMVFNAVSDMTALANPSSSSSAQARSQRNRGEVLTLIDIPF